MKAKTTPTAAELAQLDAYHAQVRGHLDRLAALAARVERGQLDAETSAEACAVEAFFSGSMQEHHRVEGFLPVEDFLAQLKLALSKMAFEREEFQEASQRFRNICREHPASGAAAEACYWAGVAEYKARNEPSPLRETARFLGEHYPQSEWARKASVWMG